MQNFIVGIDIGSSSTKASIVEIKKDGKLSLLRVLKFATEGVRKGMIDDFAAATRSQNMVLREIQNVARGAAQNIFLGSGSPAAKIQASRGIVAVSRADLEIYKDDIARAIEAAESVKLPPNRMILHSLTEEFAVDDIAGIKYPLAMVGNRLEARSLIIDAFAPAVKNLTRCMEVAGGGVAGLIFNPLAGARSVLSKNQKDLGVAIVDIGFGTTSFAVYQEGKLLHTASFPVGSGHITNDLAIGLKTSIEAGEAIKFAYGSAIAREVPQREMVELIKFDSTLRSSVSRRFISEIIEVRLAEIFELIHNDLRNLGRAGQLPAGLVLVGGGAKLPGIVDLVRQELRLPARIGVPDLSSFVSDALDEPIANFEDPEYACSLGLALWGADKMFEGKTTSFNILSRLRNIVNYFMP